MGARDYSVNVGLSWLKANAHTAVMNTIFLQYCWAAGKRLAWLILFWFLLSKLDPFGIDDLTKNQSELISATLMAPFYGYSSQAIGQDRIAVVLVTDDTARNYGHFPLTLSEHGMNLKRLVLHGVRTVLVDVSFTGLHDAEDFETLVRPLRELPAQDQAVMVFFGRGPADAGLPPALTQGDLGNHVILRGTVTSWDRGQLIYPLQTASPSGGIAATAARDLFEAFCRRGGCPAFGSVSDFQNDLVVHWGSRISDQQQRISRVERCGNFGSTFFARLLQAIRHFPASIFHGWPDRASLADLRQACPYTLNLDANYLTELELDDPILAGRAVLYGVDREGFADLVESPVHGAIPGIMFHAMALDNLFTYGPDYYYRPREFELGGSSLEPTELAEFGVWFAVSLYLAHLSGIAVVEALSATAPKQSARSPLGQPMPHTPSVHPDKAAFERLHAVWAGFIRRATRRRVFVVALLVAFLLNAWLLHWQLRDWLALIFLFELFHRATEAPGEGEKQRLADVPDEHQPC